jgi:hypothetical protein
MKAFELAGVAFKGAAWVHDYDQGDTQVAATALLAKHKTTISEQEIEAIVVKTQQSCSAAGVPQAIMDKIVASIRSSASAPTATRETLQKQAEAEVAFAVAEVAKEKAEEMGESRAQSWGQLRKMRSDAHDSFNAMGKYTTEEQKQHEAKLREQIEAAQKAGNEAEEIRLNKELAKFYKDTGRETELKALEAGDSQAVTHAQTVQKHGTNMEKKAKEFETKYRLVDKNLDSEKEPHPVSDRKLGHENHAPKDAKEAKKAENPVKEISPDEFGELMALVPVQNHKPAKTKGIS